MTLSEFKAWFEGFTEGMEGAPTADQFAKIKAKVALIDGAVTTYPVFVDRYRWWADRVWRQPDYPLYPTASYSTAGALPIRDDAVWMNNEAGAAKDVGAGFDASSAFNALGKAEAAN